MIPADREKKLAQQARAKERAIERLRAKGRKLTDNHPARKPSKPTKRHNDAPWRNACILLYGNACLSCGDVGNVEMDHIIPKSQDRTARADVENGMPLCGPFSRTTPGGCHPAKTAGTLRFEFGWFTATQLTYLAEKGWIAWDADGQPYGRGMKHFHPRRTGMGEREGGQHGCSEEGGGEPVLGSSGDGAGRRVSGSAARWPW